MTVSLDITADRILPTSGLSILEVYTDDSSFVLSLAMVDGERCI